MLSASGIYRALHHSLTHYLFAFIAIPSIHQVWFQNRRMKDKRQRIAIAWPYAAVYSDPAFAASILQAAANSVGMPYGYPAGNVHQNPLMAQQMPGNRLAYGFPPSVRYNPYPIPIPPQGYSQHAAIRSESQSSSLGSPLGGAGSGYPHQTSGLPHQSPGVTGDHPQLKSPQDLSTSSPSHETRSPTTSSNSSLSPDSDRIKCDFGAESRERTPVKCSDSLKQNEKTILPLLGEKPNLFRPYKSEV